MSLLDEISKKVDVNDEEAKYQRRKLAFLNQLEELLKDKGISKEELSDELDKEYYELITNPTLRDISRIEVFLDEELLIFKRNLKFFNQDE